MTKSSTIEKLNIAVAIIAFILLLFTCADVKKEDKLINSSEGLDFKHNLKLTSQNYLQAWSNNDTNLLKKLAIKNVVRNVNGEIISSNQFGLTETMQFWHTAIPDIKVVEREIIVVGNRSYTNWICTGTNTGMFGDIPPTGKKNKTEGFSILTFDDSGQLIHESVYYNELNFMKGWGYSVKPPILN